MNGDGSGKRPVTPPADSANQFEFAVPASIDHGGQTWWLLSRLVPGGQNYPGTTSPEWELYAFRTSYQNGEWGTHWVKLTDLLTAGTNGKGIIPEIQAVSWSNDGADSFVSFGGHDIGGGKSYVYRASIFFPEDGAPYLTEAPQPIVEVPWASTPFHWSPDGNSIVYEDNGLGVYDLPDELSDGSLRRIRSSGDSPRWSPLGDKIAFGDAYRMYTIDTDGSNLTLLYNAGSWAWSDQALHPCWSPDGKYIAFQNHLAKMSKGGVATWWDQISIVPSQGGAKTILTSDMPKAGMTPRGWRVPRLP